MLPRAPIEPEGTFTGLSAAAILFGACVDIAATVVGSTLLVLWLAPQLPTSDPAKAQEALNQLAASPAYIAANLVVGALCTVFGAFAGARRAGQLHVRHGGWIAVSSTALGVLLTSLEPVPSAGAAPLPFWPEVIAWLLILPAGMLGGALAGALAQDPNR